MKSTPIQLPKFNCFSQRYIFDSTKRGSKTIQVFEIVLVEERGVGGRDRRKVVLESDEIRAGSHIVPKSFLHLTLGNEREKHRCYYERWQCPSPEKWSYYYHRLI